MWFKGAADSVYSVLQKGFHGAGAIVGGVATAKGIYDVGRMIYGVGRTLAPLAPVALL